MVVFDYYNGLPIRDGRFPIVPVTETWNSNGARCSHTQIPLTLAFAISIHKCQGFSVDKAIIDIGESEFAAGLAYVGLSRAQRVTDVIFSPMYSKKGSMLFLAQQRTQPSSSSFNGLNKSAEPSYDMYTFTEICHPLVMKRKFSISHRWDAKFLSVFFVCNSLHGRDTYDIFFSFLPEIEQQNNQKDEFFVISLIIIISIE